MIKNIFVLIGIISIISGCASMGSSQKALGTPPTSKLMPFDKFVSEWMTNTKVRMVENTKWYDFGLLSDREFNNVVYEATEVIKDYCQANQATFNTYSTKLYCVKSMPSGQKKTIAMLIYFKYGFGNGIFTAYSEQTLDNIDRIAKKNKESQITFNGKKELTGKITLKSGKQFDVLRFGTLEHPMEYYFEDDNGENRYLETIRQIDLPNRHCNDEIIFNDGSRATVNSDNFIQADEPNSRSSQLKYVYKDSVSGQPRQGVPVDLCGIQHIQIGKTVFRSEKIDASINDHEVLKEFRLKMQRQAEASKDEADKNGINVPVKLPQELSLHIDHLISNNAYSLGQACSTKERDQGKITIDQWALCSEAHRELILLQDNYPLTIEDTPMLSKYVYDYYLQRLGFLKTFGK